MDMKGTCTVKEIITKTGWDGRIYRRRRPGDDEGGRFALGVLIKTF